MDPTHARLARATTNLATIAKAAVALLWRRVGAAQVASYCCERMELDPLFNAGVGSALQADGVPRLSAALMVGRRQSFSGVASATYLAHPSRLCLALQKRNARVLTQPGVELLARELGEPVRSNLTRERARAWCERGLARAPEGFTVSKASGADTVGCLVRTGGGRLVAAASTGGRGAEFPGRVSDTCTVAGTYASRFAAVAATGVGEQIVDDALASRLETRVRDGSSLSEASERCFREALARKRSYGWIAIDAHGWAVAHTTPSMAHVVVGLRGRKAVVLSSSVEQMG